MTHHVGGKTLKGLSFLFSQLPKSEKWLHMLTMTWVLFQLGTSFGMHVHADTTEVQLTWIDKSHMYGGLGLLVVATLFFIIVLNRRSMADLYPWVSGDFKSIKEDIGSLFKWHLPEPRAGGLAATVEGLGLLALLLAVFTGTLWFGFFTFGSAIAPDFLSIHKTAVGAIEAYIYGHGLFALLHLLTWWQSK
ncbi:hypothetical protein A1OO_13530 [Enterovibrio norvegicus FF-33]|uniref:Cytochrome b561 bacterial/Ni-hydrogenase domain-containing protein n=1 Tax=Enterovibrio norvegicus FF-454 TaxID=1185651 RepID=A0A1E5CBI3_9GAMM|nr:cytochrome b/b6 domain-containing protein [Enterovibrio norvegicus]OEE62858.1 hypothetical protein A1OK_19950 [Enterovibrio norvegicus FF-454]OEE66782.1 hypothetical protein A1OO_13530 [Enterovibrio norvegicus FF-33]